MHNGKENTTAYQRICNGLIDSFVLNLLVTVIITVLPSIYLGYRIVDKSIFENNAQRFVREQFQFVNTQVVNRSFIYDSKGNKIDLLLIGYELPKATIDTIKAKMKSYNLEGATLNVRQGLNAKQEIDFTQIKASILEDVFKQDTVRRNVVTDTPVLEKAFPYIRTELKVLYPNLKYYSLSNVVIYRMDTLPNDTVTMVVASFSKTLKSYDRTKLQQWLKTRLKADTRTLIISK